MSRVKVKKSHRFRRTSKISNLNLRLLINIMTTKQEVLSLYKSLLSKSFKFDNYNFREYSKRRVVDEFKANKALKSPEEITKFYNAGIDQLAMLTRQTTISQMYTFDKLVVEPLKKHH